MVKQETQTVDIPIGTTIVVDKIAYRGTVEVPKDVAKILQGVINGNTTNA